MLEDGINRRQFLGGSAAAVALTTLQPGMTFAASGDTLTIRAPGDIDTVDPGFWKNTTDLWVMDAVHELSVLPGLPRLPRNRGQRRQDEARDERHSNDERRQRVCVC